jgi:hypothetical protein
MQLHQSTLLHEGARKFEGVVVHVYRGESVAQALWKLLSLP